jgi:hypothetical protein
MFIVAGPPGGGKSKAFPVAGFGVDFFNADGEVVYVAEQIPGWLTGTLER